jgi:carbamoyl-phosphate synthase large subunit
MATVQIGGAGGTMASNVVRSLRESGRGDRIIGHSSSLEDLQLANVEERYLLPVARSEAYARSLLRLLERTRPDYLHVQHDFEVQAVSRLREEIAALGVALFLPADATIDDCVDKYRSYRRWHQAGLTVPKTILLETPADLTSALAELGPTVWLRATEGGGGTGAIKTDSPALARAWLDRFDGWGSFTAAECLTAETVTWSSLWQEGRLVVAQTRRRRAWAFADRAPSGITGVTRVGETWSDAEVDRVALAAIAAIDPSPHGVFSVDMAYDEDGAPNPTEINIGRFFTTIYFFTRAGLNLPAIARDLALGLSAPPLEQPLNPLPDGLLWIRGMDVEPVLTTQDEVRRSVSALDLDE